MYEYTIKKKILQDGLQTSINRMSMLGNCAPDACICVRIKTNVEPVNRVHLDEIKINICSDNTKDLKICISWINLNIKRKLFSHCMGYVYSVQMMCIANGTTFCTAAAMATLSVKHACMEVVLNQRSAILFNLQPRRGGTSLSSVLKKISKYFNHPQWFSQNNLKLFNKNVYIFIYARTFCRLIVNNCENSPWTFGCVHPVHFPNTHRLGAIRKSPWMIEPAFAQKLIEKLFFNCNESNQCVSFYFFAEILSPY